MLTFLKTVFRQTTHQTRCRRGPRPLYKDAPWQLIKRSSIILGIRLLWCELCKLYRNPFLKVNFKQREVKPNLWIVKWNRDSEAKQMVSSVCFSHRCHRACRARWPQCRILVCGLNKIKLMKSKNVIKTRRHMSIWVQVPDVPYVPY